MLLPQFKSILYFPPYSLTPEIEERPISVAGSVKSIDEESANSTGRILFSNLTFLIQ